MATLVLLLLFGSVFIAGASAVQKSDRAEKIAKKIEKDLKETGKYSEKDLDELTKVVEEITGRVLNDEEKSAAKDYIVAEIQKKIKLEKVERLATTSTSMKPERIVTTDSVGYEIKTAIGPVTTFKQPNIDITGGSGTDDGGYDYNINGGNDLYNVEITDEVYLDEGYCLGTFLVATMYYYDEDHPDPSLDSSYDQYRLAVYGRLEDIETFYIRPSTNTLCFDYIWSNDKTFAYPVGQHGNNVFSPTSTVYIAVWNHALDVNDDNPSLAKTSHYY